MKPHVICHMISSLDGSLHPSRFTTSPDGIWADWSSTYERVHQGLEGDAWIVGRTTMAEMSKAGPHAPMQPGVLPRMLAEGRDRMCIDVSLSVTVADRAQPFTSPFFDGDLGAERGTSA